jgi:multidrug efflux pump subunit AcrA (membrane-fusion protein)
MEFQLFTEQVQNLDKLLDELEDLATSDLPSSKFFAALVEHVRQTLSASSVRLLLPVAGDEWLPIASCGAPAEAAQIELTQCINNLAGESPEILTGKADGEHWLAIPVRPKHFSKGCLLTCHHGPLAPSAVSGLVEVLAAFCELVTLRQQSELESFVEETWDKAQALCLQLAEAPSYEEAATLLACGLAPLLGAVRVTLLSASRLSASRWGAPQVRAISGVPRISPHSKTVHALQNVGASIIQLGKPLLREQTYVRGADGQPLAEITDDGSFANLIGLRLANSQRSSPTTVSHETTLLVLEFQNHPEMLRSANKLSHLLPILAIAWEQQTRWLRLPRAARQLALGPYQFMLAVAPRLKWIVLLALLLLAGWGLTMPYALIIEAEGSYEPVHSREIYAADDGFVGELLVDDGSYVRAGEALVQLRSPTLELRIEQTEGAARAVEEEASGIRIAINQLASDAPDVLSNQSRLAGKIAELDTKLGSLKEQLRLLAEHRSRLLLTAPIEGYVVAKDLRRNLAGRPVRRGDSLFSVVDQAGPWQVRVQVADRDVGYLLENYRVSVEQPPSSAQEMRSDIEYCLASAPDERFPAKIHWIADQVENRYGAGCSLEVRATVDASKPEGAHAGAGVHCFFECGQQPLWFVWCRPLVEATQRRLWFHHPQAAE